MNSEKGNERAKSDDGIRGPCMWEFQICLRIVLILGTISKFWVYWLSVIGSRSNIPKEGFWIGH